MSAINDEFPIEGTRPPPAHSVKSLVKAFSLMSSTTILAISMSVITNKIISLVAGTEGIAISGLFRNLGALISGTVTFGYSTIIIELLSNAKTKARTNAIINSAGALFVLQCSLGIILILFFAESLAHWTFSTTPSPTEIFEIRIVLVMALINLALQTVISILKGQGHLKMLSWVQLATSGSSLLLIYPLLKLGRTGLAINVGSGGILAGLLGFIFIQKAYSPSLSWQDMKKGFRDLRAISIPSLLVTLDALITLGGLLAVQSIVNGTYGLPALGNYNAALLVVDTSVMILMSSLRSHLLPSLGKTGTDSEKHRLFGLTLTLLLIIGTSGAVILILGARWIIPLLFSKKFSQGVGLLSLMSLSMIGHILGYCSNTILLQRGNYRLIFCLDACFILLYAALAYSAKFISPSPMAIGAAYALAASIMGSTQLLITLKIYGWSFLNRRNTFITIGSFAWLCLAYILSQESSLIGEILFLMTSAIVPLWYIRNYQLYLSKSGAPSA